MDRSILEDGGVAVEDLTAADLDGDGKIDIIAVDARPEMQGFIGTRGSEESRYAVGGVSA